MSKWLELRRSLVGGAALMLFASTLAFAGAPSVKEEKAAGSSCTYYSDASKTIVVGRFGKDCCNNTVAWGMKTKFSVCGGCFPCTPPPR